MDFVALMEFGKKDDKSVREAALLLKNWFMLGADAPRDNKPVREKKKESVKEEPKINRPLKFELTSLDPDHQFFEVRGIKPATVKTFGLGYCRKGLMKDRIAIPVHDHNGRLVAYCGRGLTPEQITELRGY